MENLFLISLTTSVVILALLILSPFLDKRYSARWKYFVWLIIAIRLVIPFRFEFSSAPIKIDAPPLENIEIIQKDFNVEHYNDNTYIQEENNLPKTVDSTPHITINTLIFLIWLLGSISFFLYHIFSYIRFRQKIKPYLKPFDTEYEIPILTCEKIQSPMMIGFLKSIILLPPVKYNNEELDVILKHELTHFKRHDLWYKLLLVIVNAVHFFNPFVYLMVNQANKDLEYSCDDLVVNGMDSDYKKNYSLIILKSMNGGRKQ